MSARLDVVPNGADALFIASAAQGESPLIVITAQASDAERLVAEIPWFAPHLKVHRLPDWETLAYDQFSPHPDLISERLATLSSFMHGQVDVGIVPIATALVRLCPKAYLAGRAFALAVGARLDIRGLREQLATAGYAHVGQVMSPGEFSVRGSLVDLFPMGSALPYRIDLDDAAIDSIRTFDVDTQRSIYPVKEIRLLPAREFPLDKEGQNTFRLRFRERFEGDPSKAQIYKDVSNGLAPAGIEYFLPLFFEHTATFFDYLPPGCRVLLHRDVAAAAEAFSRDAKGRYLLLRGDRDRPLLEPREVFVPVEEFFTRLKAFARQDMPAAHLRSDLLAGIAVDRRSEAPLRGLASLIAQDHWRVLLVADGPGRRETIHQFLLQHDLAPRLLDGWGAFAQGSVPFALTHGPLACGFVAEAARLVVITENELYAEQVRQARRRDARLRASAEGALRDLAEVKPGDPVVHVDHGIGRYLGLVLMDLGEGGTEFMHLEYEGGDKLYVPVSQLAAVSRYTGVNPENAPLHRLGSGQWEKAKRRAAQQVRDTAAELLNLYAQRAARKGYAFPLKPDDYDAFAAGFAFEETPDQAAAIQAVIADMTAGRPMDRLVCGDVGFGKTEVALRAAFIAVMAGRQVAILVPTTLLAEQHFKNFSDRFADFPVRIAELSRFRTGKEIARSVEGLATGNIDIVIGTHRLVQKDVQFKNLGLVIIDEEHRFGVRQKEELKALRAEVDVLTLTATPIPRTLAMSLEGLRDFSVIATAPQKRLAIKTFVCKQSDGIVREAVLRELKRGGQVYYLYNEVETIGNQCERLAALLPEARIAVAHGQLPERELEHVMRDFYHQRTNLLLCSTIIETGIDVPNANTILMHRADRFGLAQLHQLRGRVGRSHHQAYAYLLTPPEEALSSSAKKRLEAITLMEDLGAGFHLAMHDLEIRGAGEVLGDSQSGGIHDVGFALYTDMLAQAVASLRAGREPDLARPLHVSTEINLHLPALLPETYCADVHDRLVLYKRLANCAAADELDALAEELIDRFGPLPEAAQSLVESHRLRLLGKTVGISKIDAGPEAIVITFIAKPPVEPHAVIHAVQKRRGRLTGPDRIRIEGRFEQLGMRTAEVRSLIRELTPARRAA
jgi:transcription-repair coupling factor (superfamily II helicase)